MHFCSLPIINWTQSAFMSTKSILGPDNKYSHTLTHKHVYMRTQTSEDRWRLEITEQAEIVLFNCKLIYVPTSIWVKSILVSLISKTVSMYEVYEIYHGLQMF